MVLFLRSFIVVLLLASAGCGGRAVLGPAIGSQVDPSGVVPLYVATSRAPSEVPGLPYSAMRSRTLNFARVDVAIPQNHRVGQVETSSHRPDPRRHFSADSFTPLPTRSDLVSGLNAALARRAPADREILLFVHGYNNNFADGVFRNAQIVHDYNITAVALHYSWPSGAAIPLYIFDRDSALLGRRGLAETIEIAAQTKARRIVIIGHSMGAFVVAEALRDLALQGRSGTLRRLGGVVLAAPDIDTDVFLSQLDDIGDVPQPFSIVVSQRDRALGFSRRLAGGKPRVGSGSDVELLQQREIAVVDVSDVDGGSHGVFASSSTLMDVVNNDALLRNILRGESPPGQSVLADSALLAEGAASLVIFLPRRLLEGLPQAARTQ